MIAIVALAAFVAFFSVGVEAEVCLDVSENCLKFQHLCKIKGTWENYMRKFCKRTCKFCGPQPPPGPSTPAPTPDPSGCKDIVINCEDVKQMCNELSWRDFMKVNCQKTCPNYCVRYTGPPTTLATRGTIPPGSCGRSTVSQSRVIAGVDAKRGAWPWMVSLNLNGYHTCGGTLITPTWVLTAAHCTFKKSPTSYRIVAGEHDRSYKEGSEQTVGVKRIINHPNYQGKRITYDIALMELDQPIKLDSYSQLVCLPHKGYKPQEGRKCYLSGWGTTTHPGNAAVVLQQAMLPVVNKKHCHNQSGFVCTGFGKTSKTNACRGDSGGPLVCQENDGRWVQQGVASFVVEYCKYYTAFTRIGDHMDWIRSYVNV